VSEFGVPVVFDVDAADRGQAAGVLCTVLALADLVGKGVRLRRPELHGRVESWWFPEAEDKAFDGNDNAAMTLVHDSGKLQQQVDRTLDYLRQIAAVPGIGPITRDVAEAAIAGLTTPILDVP
jgi:hypothetical protein